MNNRIFAGIIIFLVIFPLAYGLIYQIVHVPIQNDIKAHTNFITGIISGEKFIPHPLWHIFVLINSKFLNIDLLESAITTSALLITITAILLFVVLFANLRDQYKTTYIVLLTFLLMIAGPIYIYFFNGGDFYVGQWGPNPWHNPTIFTVKPFALLSVIYTLLYIENNKLKYFLIGMTSLIISIFAKPSFIIVFLPALFVYLIIKNRHNITSILKNDRNAVIYFLCISLITVIVLFIQYINYYDDTISIIYSPFSAWEIYTTSIVLSIFLALAFPIFVQITNIPNDKYLNFSWILTFVSLGYFILFTEIYDDKISDAANFAWGYIISIYLVFIFSIIKYLKYYHSYHAIYRMIINIVLFLHFTSGLVYFYRLLVLHTFR